MLSLGIMLSNGRAGSKLKQLDYGILKLTPSYFLLLPHWCLNSSLCHIIIKHLAPPLMSTRLVPFSRALCLFLFQCFRPTAGAWRMFLVFVSLPPISKTAGCFPGKRVGNFLSSVEATGKRLLKTAANSKC